jgi:hypothetical protein
MAMKLSIFLGPLLALCLCSCASIMTRPERLVTFTSDPVGATVTVIDDHTGLPVQAGRTPLTVPLRTSAGYFEPARYVVEFSKPGYLPTVTSLEAHMSGWYGGNIFLGLLPGILVVDPVSGSMWTLKRRHYSHLIEDPAFRPATTKATALKVTSLDQVPLCHRSQLVRVN